MLPRINWLALCLLALSLSIVVEAQPLRDAADARGLHIGAAVNMSPFRNESIYTQTLGREFNMLVAENAFKFDALHPAQNTYNFTDADALVAFAEANNMAVRGHTLVWHSQIPGWLTGGNFSRDQVIAIMRDHIMTVVGRYRGRILAWDVVNEAVSDNNGQFRTDSFWHQKIGPEYIAMAFQFAHEADPDAKSFDVRSVAAGRAGELRLDLVGVRTRAEALALAGGLVLVAPEELRALGPGEYYGYQLLGCRVEGEDGTAVGTLREIWETGGSDVLVVEDERGARHLLPAALLRRLDAEQGRIVMEILPGLLAAE